MGRMGGTMMTNVRNRVQASAAWFGNSQPTRKDNSMAGAASIGDYTERAGLARQAGCDMLLVCNNGKAAEQVLDSLQVREKPDRQRRLQAMLGQNKPVREDLLSSEKWQTVSQKIKQFYESHA